MPWAVRFALLEHDWPYLHLDLLLQWEDSLLTWRVPPATVSLPQKADRIPNHRLIYLDYQGPVSQNRGQVVQRDAGPMRWLVQSEVICLFDLFGNLWKGRYRLRKENPHWIWEQL